KQVADHPAESPKEYPEERGPCFQSLGPKRRQPSAKNQRNRGHGGQFPDCEYGYKREWVHPAEVSFAVGDVHRSLEHARSKRRQNSRRDPVGGGTGLM